MANDPAARAAKALDEEGYLQLAGPVTGLGLDDAAALIRREYAEFMAAARALRARRIEHLADCPVLYYSRHRPVCACGLDAALARFDAAAEGTE